MQVACMQGGLHEDKDDGEELHAEVVEYASGMARELMGEVVENVSNGIDTYSLRQPLGVSPLAMLMPQHLLRPIRIACLQLPAHPGLLNLPCTTAWL